MISVNGVELGSNGGGGGAGPVRREVTLAATAMTNFDTLDVGSLDEDLIALDNCLLPWPHGIAPLV